MNHRNTAAPAVLAGRPALHAPRDPSSLRAWTAALMIVLGAAALTDISLDATTRHTLAAQLHLR